eukprot:CAMPEP_0119220248 /NCGR_PEP_ID=MMETSP1327-20130426/25436_1 /TAXON_ID=38833 /ORGANISM="Micromonas pusilla, Strain RCC2306" /LENGTH=71 /DNA_ID=CAMNT_0007218359 /DNA_START=205 /DNA_END=416 /DNA_ORIENTATION=+
MGVTLPVVPSPVRCKRSSYQAQCARLTKPRVSLETARRDGGAVTRTHTTASAENEEHAVRECFSGTGKDPA